MDSYDYLNIRQRNENRNREALLGSGFAQRNADAYQNPALHRGLDPLNQDRQHLPVLEADQNILPLAKKSQVKKRRPFQKARFIEDVRKLNKSAQGLAPAKNAEKGYFVLDLYRIKAMKVKDEDGKEQSLPADIKKVLSTLDDYVSITATARQNATQRGWNKLSIIWWAIKVWTNTGGSRSKIKKEHELVAKLKKQLADVIPRYKKLPAYDAVTKELEHVYHKMILTSGTIKGTFASNEERTKSKWADYDPHTSKELNGVGKKIQTTSDDDDPQLRYVQEKDVIVDKKKQPLFAHRPCVEDICQGAAGNCYFLAALAAIPGDKIRNMMLDHEDGTVTVRFFEKDEMTERRRPVYVTVDKVVKVNGSLDCLWVQVMEKAYALFKQTRAKHRFVFRERKVKNPDTGEMVIPTPKMIERDTIDLGFVANGGYSNEVLGDLLGTYDEKIELKTIKTKRKPSAILMDALRCMNEKGKADSRIDRLKEELTEKENHLTETARSMGLSVGMLIMLSENNEVLKGYIDDYRATKARIETEIKELREKHQLTAPERIEVRNDVRVVDDEKQVLPYKVAEEELIGMEEECEAAKIEIRKKLLAIGTTDEIAIQSAIQSALAALVKFPKTLIDTALQRDQELTTNSVADYQFLLKTLVNCAKIKDAFFVSIATANGSLADYLNGDRALAVEILSKFSIPILNRMSKNLVYMEDFSENNEIGEEDEIAVRYFDRITDMLSKGQSVCCGTKMDTEKQAAALSGESISKGMVGRHAYTILNTTVTKDGVRMLKLRNPFASFTVDYKLNKQGTLEAVADKTDTNGVFWIELNHFMKYVNQIYGSGSAEPGANQGDAE